MGLVFESLQNKQKNFAHAAILALDERTLVPNIYHRFIRGQATDLDEANSVSRDPEMETLRETKSGALIAALLICGACEMMGERTTPLEQSIREVI